MSDAETFVYVRHNKRSNTMEHILSFVPLNIGFEKGVPAEGVIGVLTHGPEFIDENNFVPNRSFVEYVHKVISENMSECPKLAEEAKRQHQGSVYIIDGRAIPVGEDVAQEDVIGVVGVENGVVTKYQHNPHYRVLTAKGLMQLDPWLHDRLIEGLEGLAGSL